MSLTLSVSNIQNPNSTPRLRIPAPPYLRTRTSREIQFLVSLDARRFSSKAIQVFSSKRINLLISLPDFLLLRNDSGRILCWGMLEESRRTCLKILVISYKSMILRVHRSVLLKISSPVVYQINISNAALTRPTTRGTQQSFIRGVTAPAGMNPLPIYIPFLTEKVSSFVYFPLKNGVS